MKKSLFSVLLLILAPAALAQPKQSGFKSGEQAPLASPKKLAEGCKDKKRSFFLYRKAREKALEALKKEENKILSGKLWEEAASGDNVKIEKWMNNLRLWDKVNSQLTSVLIKEKKMRIVYTKCLMTGLGVLSAEKKARGRLKK